MQRWVLISCSLLALVSADGCPDGGRCKDGQSCCNDPANGYECCPFAQAECCGDHDHCCPSGTLCHAATSSCVNATASFPWVERASANPPRLSKSFRMIKSYIGEEDDNICPDQSRCPAEFSCLKALNKFGCCPLAKGVPCSDGKHCCPDGHECSADCRSCVKKDFARAVLCSDKFTECPVDMTCCETPTGTWGCCPLPKAVCCADKIHCCNEGSNCDVENFKCISNSTKKVTPMWAKFPGRIRASWENQKDGERVTAGAMPDHSEKAPKVTTGNTIPPTKEEVFIPAVTEPAAGNEVPCDDTVACPDNNTCCKTADKAWACCPLPEAVCCSDFIHCCPKGKKCNLAAQTCEDEKCSVPLVKKMPTIPKKVVKRKNVPCDSSHSCPDDSTCCKKKSGEWACCPLSQAVCCDDHEHCCPSGTTCDLTTLSCKHSSGTTPMQPKIPALTTMGSTTMESASLTTCNTAAQQSTTKPTEVPKKKNEGEKKGVDGHVQCDTHTTCPPATTCCFMKSVQKWGCCPLPQAVCCSDGSHCCPQSYKCSENQTSCVKGEVVIPWYTKIPSTTRIPADPSAVQCDSSTQCPTKSTCCQLSSGEWGCCPLEEAVCCSDKKHCCPHGYTCNIASNSCQKVIMVGLETLPLVPVVLPEQKMEHQPELPPPELRDVKCDETTSCQDGQTCCRMSASTWGCCPFPKAVCCKDMLHCCPLGWTCTSSGDCTQNSVFNWKDWQGFKSDKKRSQTV